MIDIASRTTLSSLWDQKIQSRSDTEFLVYLDAVNGIEEHYTYTQFEKRFTQAANLFLELGVSHGQRVAVQLENRVEFLECLFGLAKIGAVMVPLDASYTASESKYIIDKCQITLLITQKGLPSNEEMSTFVSTVLYVDEEGECGYEKRRNSQALSLKMNIPVKAADIVQILFTSGTTSKPKGVMLTHSNMVFSGLYVDWELQITEEDRYLTAMAVNRVNFQLSALMPVLTAGATLIMVRKYSARRFWNQVRRTEATLVQSMAMIAKTMLKQQIEMHEKDHRVRLVHHFLPLSNEEKREFEQRFDVTLINNYGSSETLVGAVTDLPMQPRQWPSIGKPGLGYQVRVVDTTGKDVPQGECGELLIHGTPGTSLMAGYWAEPEATENAIDENNWYHSGDWGYEDENGWIYFLDRACDLIKRAGENISALEVEEALLKVEGVEEAAVIGVPDPIRDEAVKAVVVLKNGSALSADEIRELSREQLADFKVPSLIEIRENLPIGAYGKIIKHILKEEHKKERS